LCDSLDLSHRRRRSVTEGRNTVTRMRHGSQGAPHREEGAGGDEGSGGGIANGPSELPGGIAGLNLTMSDIASPEKSILKTLASPPSHQTSPAPFSLHAAPWAPATGMWRITSAVQLRQARRLPHRKPSRLPSTQAPELSRDSVAVVEVELPSIDLAKVLTPALALFPCVVEQQVADSVLGDRVWAVPRRLSRKHRSSSASLGLADCSQVDRGCGANPSTLERKRSRDRHTSGPK